MQELVCGSLAGGANIATGFPFDTIKVKLQGNPGRYIGMFHCFRSVWREEGVRNPQ